MQFGSTGVGHSITEIKNRVKVCPGSDFYLITPASGKRETGRSRIHNRRSLTSRMQGIFVEQMLQTNFALKTFTWPQHHQWFQGYRVIWQAHTFRLKTSRHGIMAHYLQKNLESVYVDVYFPGVNFVLTKWFASEKWFAASANAARTAFRSFSVMDLRNVRLGVIIIITSSLRLWPVQYANALGNGWYTNKNT